MASTTLSLSTNNSLLKILALLIAYFYWSLLANFSLIERTISISTSDSQSNLIVEPKTIELTVHGTRQSIRALEKRNLSLTIASKTKQPSDKIIAIKSHHIALPSNLRVVNYFPRMVTIKSHPSREVQQSE